MLRCWLEVADPHVPENELSDRRDTAQLENAPAPVEGASLERCQPDFTHPLKHLAETVTILYDAVWPCRFDLEDERLDSVGANYTNPRCALCLVNADERHIVFQICHVYDGALSQCEEPAWPKSLSM